MMRRWLLLILMAGVLGCSAKSESENPFVGVDIRGGDFGQSFELTDHQGQVRRLKDFEGKLVAIFFGYTNCPDVCPTTLDDISKAMKLLGDRRSEVQVLFVTLDPERDTQEKLGQYVPAFDPSFLGLRGTPEQTVATAAHFKVFYQKQSSGSKAGYLIDHSSGIYVFDKQGAIRLYLNYGQKPQDIAHDLQLLM